MTSFKFQLGQRLKDIVTGVEGICTSRTEHLNGCRQYGIKPPLDKDGKVPDAEWIDENQLVVVDAGVRPHYQQPAQVGGGPQEHPRT